MNKQINRMISNLQFYDKHGYFPFDKVRVDITLSKESLNKLSGKNKSKIINDLILNQM